MTVNVCWNMHNLCASHTCAPASLSVCVNTPGALRLCVRIDKETGAVENCSDGAICKTNVCNADLRSDCNVGIQIVITISLHTLQNRMCAIVLISSKPETFHSSKVQFKQHLHSKPVSDDCR